MDQCNRKLGFDSPKVIIIMDMRIFDNDNFSRGWPSQRCARTGDCTRELGPGGREGDLATMSQTSTSLSTSNSFSYSSKVSLLRHLYFMHWF